MKYQQQIPRKQRKSPVTLMILQTMRPNPCGKVNKLQIIREASKATSKGWLFAYITINKYQENKEKAPTRNLAEAVLCRTIN